MALSVNEKGDIRPVAPSGVRGRHLSFGEVLGVHALTYVDLESLLQEGEQEGEAAGEASLPRSPGGEMSLVSRSLVGQAWTSVRALVRLLVRHLLVSLRGR